MADGETRVGSADSLRNLASCLAAAMPVLVLASERFAGWVGLAWLVFAALSWKRAAPAWARHAVLGSAVGRGFIGFFVVVVLLCTLHGGGWLAATHNPSRLVLVLPMAIVVAGLGPSIKPFLAANALGAIYCGVFSLVQVLWQGEALAHGLTNPNKFGFIAQTFGLVCLCALRVAPQRRPALGLLLAGVLGGAVAMVLSGTRSLLLGGVLAVLLMMALDPRWRASRRARRTVGVAAAVLAALLVGAMTVGPMRESIAVRRIVAIGDELTSFRSGRIIGSVGERMEMWWGSFRMGLDHPLIGVGPGHYTEAAQAMGVPAASIRSSVTTAIHTTNTWPGSRPGAGRAGRPGRGLVRSARLLRQCGSGKSPIARLCPWGAACTPTSAPGSRVGPVDHCRRPAGDPRTRRDRRGPGRATASFVFFDAYFYIHFSTVYYALSVAMLVGFTEAARARARSTAAAEVMRAEDALVRRMASGRASLSAVVITKNEARRLPRCLDSVAFADEIVVLDSGSTDDTIEIARQRGARVVSSDSWPGFGPQKNRALELAGGDWVLSIDADEAVDDRLRGEIQTVLSAAPVAYGYWIERRSYYGERPVRFGDWAGDRVLRLVRQGHARFTDDAIHEQLQCREPHGELGGRLSHFTLDSFDDSIEKSKRYALAGAPRVAARGRGGPVSAALHAGWSFVRGYVLRLGFVDGLDGLRVAAGNAYGTWLRYRIAGRIRQGETAID
ncbi:MAG: glycosyltransferase family 2 protein [Burkholderiaceae bacterium]